MARSAAASYWSEGQQCPLAGIQLLHFNTCRHWRVISKTRDAPIKMCALGMGTLGLRGTQVAWLSDASLQFILKSLEGDWDFRAMSSKSEQIQSCNTLSLPIHFRKQKTLCEAPPQATKYRNNRPTCDTLKHCKRIWSDPKAPPGPEGKVSTKDWGGLEN